MLSKKSWVLKLINLSLVSGLWLSCYSCTKNQDQFSYNRERKWENNASRHVDSLTFYGEQVTPEKERQLLAENVIYFGYDQDEIGEQYELLLLAHAKKMLENPQLKLRLDGHTDERGSAEYNIGLGERRSRAAIKFIESKGIPKHRLISVSYGKEKPVVIGSTEEAWRLNRRVEIYYE